MDKKAKIFFQILIPIIFLLIGISIFSYPMFLNFDKMPGDYADARFINYVLEHGFLWLNNIELHKSFWDLLVGTAGVFVGSVPGEILHALHTPG